MELHELTMSRTIPAKVEDVFDAWIDPQNPGGLWYGCKRLILNPVVDGLYYNVFEHEGGECTHYGRFVHVDRPHRVEHTWVSESTHGLESVVTLTLEPRDGQTVVTLRHTGLPDAESVRQHNGGWTGMLDALHEQFVPRAVTA